MTMALAAGWVVSARPLPQQDVAALIAHVSARVAAYYERAQRLVCLERSTVLPIDRDWRVVGFGRTVESELRVEVGAADGDVPSEPRVTRVVRRVNGREPRASDLTDRSGCTDPTPLSPVPLAFLLPEHRDEYRFTNVREAKEGGRPVLTIDFASARRGGHPVLIEDEGGHDDCYDWTGPLPITGRLWVDASTYDVVRLERHLAGPTDVRVPPRLQRAHSFPMWLTIDRDDLTIRYDEVSFSDPDEVMLLPASIESMTVLRTTLQSARRTQVFSDYRRFLTGGRIRRSSDQSPARLELTYSPTFVPSTSSGTLPPSTTTSSNAFKSYVDPSAAFALSRWRLISLWPTL
jgi:hypothetical protein